jgi:hypothetical protein
MTGLNDSISVIQGFIGHYPAGPNKMPGIVALAEVADLHAGHGCMNKPVIIQVNTHMGNGMALAQGMEKNQIAFP